MSLEERAIGASCTTKQLSR